MGLELQLQKRKKFGKKARTLVEDGQVLGNLYGAGRESIAVNGDYNEVNRVVNEAGHNIPIDLVVDGKDKLMGLVNEVERDNITQRLHHVTFHIVKKGEKVQTEIPIKFTGDAPATREGLILVTILDHVEVEAVPSKLPEFFEISLESLTDESSVLHVSDLQVDEKDVEIMTDGELLLAKIDLPRPEEELEEDMEEEPTDPAEVPSEHGGDEDEESPAGDSSDDSDTKAQE